MAIDIGRIAYQTFHKKLYPNDISHPNHPSNLWENLGKWEQDAWRSAAVAVLQYIDEEKERCEKDPEYVG